MKLVNFTCPGCGAQLNVDADLKQATCQFCGITFPIDDEAQHVKFDGAEQAGYDFEKGRQRAQQEQIPQTVYVEVQPAQPKPKRKTWLWVLGWIFIFPVPLTIIMLKNESVKEKLDPKVRYAIIAIGWLLYLAIGVFGGGGSNSNSAEKANSGSSAAVATQSVSSSSSKSAASASSEAASVTSQANAIELTAGEMGAYGQELTMSEGTDMEEKLIVYYVPAGAYQVENLGSYRTQVNVYEGVRKGDNGYDEYTNTGDILMLDAGQTGELKVPEGWFIEIQEPTHISLTPKA